MSTLQQRRYLNLALLGLAALLLLAVFYSPEQQTDAPMPLLALDGDSIHHLRIERPGQESIELQAAEDGWQMLSPYAHPANSLRIDALLRISALPSLGRIALANAPLEEYRLAPPAVTLIINRQQQLAFGGQTALDQRRYVMLGDTIHVVPDTLYYHLIGAPATFLAQQLLPPNVRIEALHLPGLTLQRQQGQWQLEPAGLLDSADQIQLALDAWQHAGVIQIRPYQGREGRAVNVVLSDGSSLQLVWVHHGEERLLAHPELGLEYHLSEASAREMLLKIDTISHRRGAETQRCEGANLACTPYKH